MAAGRWRVCWASTIRRPRSVCRWFSTWTMWRRTGPAFRWCRGAIGSNRTSAFPEIARIEEMPHHVALRVKAGAAVVLHGNLWQAQTRNRSETPQRFLAYSYVHCWMRQALPEPVGARGEGRVFDTQSGPVVRPCDFSQGCQGVLGA